MAEDLRQFNEFQQQQEESIDFKAIFFKLINNWYLFVITVFVALVIAFLFNKYSKTVHEVSTTVLVQDERGQLSTQELIGIEMSGNKQNLENEIGILKSYAVANRAIKNLDFEVSYFQEDNFIVKEMYENPPFKVVFDESHPQMTGVPINIDIKSPQKYKIDIDAEKFSAYDYTKNTSLKEIEKSFNFNEKLKFGEWVETDFFKFKIDSLDFQEEEQFEKLKSKRLFFKFNNLNSLTKRFQGFSIEPINREASIVRLSMQNDNKQKAVDFLNTLTDEYLERGLEKKNKIASKTIEFIDDQLKDIKDSLSKSEKKLQKFRSKNEVMNLEHQSQQLFEQMKELQNKKAELMVKSQYYHHLKNYIKKNESVTMDDVIVPSALGIEDPVLAELVKKLTKLYEEKSRLAYSTKKENVLIGQINNEIELTKKTLLENVNNMINTSEISISDINQRIEKLSSRLNSLPGTQRQLFNIERQFKLLDNIYTFLME
ncbi:MAG: hypothetical protein K9I68_09865, partial [Bacteroidales bacterium]|nr:hypothetical protein [Bacteroidales bacterium]